MAGKIIGNQNPVVGIQHPYEINTLASILMGGFSTPNSVYEWYLYKKQKNGTWKDITQTPKKGIKVSYSFGEISLGVEFRMKVYEVKSGLLPSMTPSKTLEATLDIVPSSSKIPQIEKVVLFKKSGDDVNQANYRDTLTAQAHCIAMFDQEVEFTLWEDDAAEGGHNLTINKNNRSPRIYKARVNEKGIAEVKIPLSSDEKILKQIANKYLMKGDKNEGKNHEYYVTASYHGKIQKASQVNVDVENPDYKKEQPKQQVPPSKQPTLPPKKPEPEKTTSKPQKPQPKQNTPKFPATKTSAAPKQADSQGRITDAYFVNNSGQRLTKAAVGDWVRVCIHTSNMTGKHVQFVVWEYDTVKNDEIFKSGRLEVKGDIITTAGFTITEKMFEKGADVGDSKSQNYFIEVLPLDVSAYSKRFGVSSDGLMEVEKTISAASVNASKQNKAKSICICEQYNLSWGNKFTCEERKKVVQICAELWGEPRKKEMANHLMNCMALETGEKFKPDTGYSSGGATGLVQWTGSAIDGMNKNNKYNNGKILTKKALASMTILQQLEYVKLYFKMWMDSGKVINDSLDMYMCIWCPAAVGKEDSFVCYSEKNSSKNYNANKSIDGEYYREKYINAKGKTIYNTVGKSDGNGEITKGELRPRLKVKQVSGINYKEINFTCDASQTSINAKDIITFHIYTDGKIEKHIPKNIKEEYKKKYKYIYHDKDGKEHNICIVEFTIAQNWIVGSKIDGGKGWEKRVAGGKTRYYQKGNGEVELVKVIVPLNYNQKGVNIKIGDNTDREYINPKAFASMLGAVAECGYNDFNFNGSTSSDGTGAPSVTHVNGVSFDFRYLRKDKTGNNLHIDTEPNSLDILREEKFIDALIKFGYSKFYSYNITVNGKPFILKNSTHLADHNHHLHIRREGYNPKYKEIKE